MDSQTTISVDRNLVENVEATLRNIGGYCPSDIVAKAREKNPCITNADPDDLETLLENLDREIQIDIKDQGIKKFGNEVLLFVETIVKCFEIYEPKFRVTPAGSFPLGLKIEEMDEFDFVLEWINMPEQLTEICEYSSEGYYKNTKGIPLHVILSKCKNTGKVSIERLTCQKPAINIVLSWSCPRGCKHGISLDLAASKKSGETWKHRKIHTARIEGTPFGEVIQDDEPVYYNSTFLPFFRRDRGRVTSNDSSADTNYQDQAIFDMFDERMPTNKKILRVLKFIFKHIFPKFCKYQYCALHKKWIHVYEPVITSYALKQLLYYEVKKEWKDGKSKNIISQIISILRRISDGKFHDLLSGREKNVSKVSFHFIDDWVSGLVSWFKNGYKRTTDNIVILKEEKNRYEGLFLFSDLLITAANEPTTITASPCFKELPNPINPFIPLNPLHDLLKLDLPTTFTKDTKNHKRKVVYGIYHCIGREVAHQINHLDLRPYNAFYFFHFLNLCHERMFAIGETEFKSERIIGEINNLEKILSKFSVTPDKIAELQKNFPLSFCDYNYDCQIKLRKIVYQMTLKEVIQTYKNLAANVKTSKCERDLNASNDIGKQNNNTTNKDKSQWLRKILEVFGDEYCSFCRACVWLCVAIACVIKVE